MTDQRLRELERSWLASGDVEDEVRYLGVALQAGTLSRDRLELAAHVGHPAARRVLGLPLAAEEEGAGSALGRWLRSGLRSIRYGVYSIDRWVEESDQLRELIWTPDERDLSHWVYGLQRAGAEACHCAALAAARLVAHDWGAVSDVLPTLERSRTTRDADRVVGEAAYVASTVARRTGVLVVRDAISRAVAAWALGRDPPPPGPAAAREVPSHSESESDDALARLAANILEEPSPGHPRWEHVRIDARPEGVVVTGRPDRPQGELNGDLGSALIARLKCIAGLDPFSWGQPQEGACRWQSRGRTSLLRIRVEPHEGWESCVVERALAAEPG